MIRMQFAQLKRREVITFLGGVAAWPLAARAQQPERMRRIGVLLARSLGRSGISGRPRGVHTSSNAIGLEDGHNLRIDTRWATAADIRRHATELAAPAPDVLVAGTGSVSVAPLLDATRSVPIVFVVSHRPGRRRFCRKPRTAGWQRDRVHDVRIRRERKMVGVAQKDRAARDAGGRPWPRRALRGSRPT